jgi:hypothetical protein
MRYTEIYEKMIIKEAVDYMSLFNPLIKIGSEIDDELEIENLKKAIQTQIKSIKSSLVEIKGNQRWAMYLMKAYRAFLARNYLMWPESSEFKTQLEKLAFTNEFPINVHIRISDMKNVFQHYSAYKDYEPIKRYDPSGKTWRQVEQELSNLEQKYFEEIGDDDKLLELQDGDKIVKDFGDGYVWLLLNRGACRDEGDAMGHCGNIPSQRSGDRVLSFRKKRDRAGKEFYEPFMTFIYNQDTKKLGEMKGRSNEKPHEKYHPYIIWLLKQKWIKGLGPRGYAPEEDFQLDDLTKEQREDVINSNPNFLLNNGTKLSKIPKDVLENSGIPSVKQTRSSISWFSEDKSKIYINIDLDNLIDSGLLKFIADPYKYFDASGVSDNDIADMLSYLNENNMKVLYEKYYKKIIIEAGMTESDFLEFEEFSAQVKRDNFFDIFQEYLDEEDEPIDFDDLSTTYEELKYELTSMNYALQETAYERSVLKQVIKNMPEFSIGDVDFVFSDKFMSKSGDVYGYIADDSEYAIYETDQYFNEDEDELYYALNVIRKVDIDDRYIDTSYGKDDINDMFSNYL